MTIKDGPTEAIYRACLTNGGQVRFVIEPHDIDFNRDFEKTALTKPHLDIGFTLEPPTTLFAREQWGAVAMYGGGWHGIIYGVYGRKGTITYKRLSPELYEAVCDVPKPGAATTQ